MLRQPYRSQNLQYENEQIEKQNLQQLLIQSITNKRILMQYIRKLLELSPDKISTEHLIRIESNQQRVLNRFEEFYVENFGEIPIKDVESGISYINNYSDALLFTLDKVVELVAFDREVLDLLQTKDILNALQLYTYAYRVNTEQEILLSFLYSHNNRLNPTLSLS